jgi:hypothetical protein
MPALDVVLAYADACGADDRTRARALWRKAQYWHHVPARDQTRKVRPAKIHPQYVENFAQLQRAMLDMRRAAGWPSLRAMEATALAHGHRLPRSTLALVLTSRAALHKHLFLAYLHACGARTTDHPAWEAAWDRANDKTTDPDPGPAPAPTRPPRPPPRNAAPNSSTPSCRAAASPTASWPAYCTGCNTSNEPGQRRGTRAWYGGPRAGRWTAPASGLGRRARPTPSVGADHRCRPNGGEPRGRPRPRGKAEAARDRDRRDRHMRRCRRW